MQLKDILISTEGLNKAGVEALGRKLYTDIYVPKGDRAEVVTEDGLTVVFYLDRFDHAFKTSSDRARRPDDKDVISEDRVQRIRWILEIINKRVSGTTCKEVPSPNGRRWPPNRLYTWSNYVVWLEPLRDGRWKFSSAYTARPEDVRGYHKKAVRFVWAAK